MASNTLSPVQTDPAQAAIDTAEFFTLFDRMDDVAKRLLFEVINGMSRGRLSVDEVEEADKRMRAGADKFSELESLVDLSNHRLYDEPLVD